MKQISTTSRNVFFSGALLLMSFANQVNAQCTPPPAPVAPGTLVCSGSSATLTAAGAGPNYNWFATSAGSLVASTQMYTTGTLTTNTTYYVAQYATTTADSLTLPSQTSTYSGSSRGYFFIAPTTMTITGVRVPTDVGTGNYDVAIIRFPSVPPVYPSLTNTFTIAYLAQNQAGTGIVPVNIPVGYGEVIGVLGDRADVNSYASPAPFNNMAFGSYSVTLNRIGMQFPLSSTTPQDLWQEASGSISRVELYADLACMSALAAVNVTVSTCTGIEEIHGGDVRFAPNPAHDAISVKVSPEAAGNATIEIYDAIGKLVAKEAIQSQENKFDVSTLEKGIYIYKITTAKKEMATGKFVKE